MEFDHVLIAVADLEASVGAFESLYGLASVEGGRHPGWGTANRIVPLGDAYLELVAVVDQDEAAGSVFGRWVLSGQVGSPLGWAVRTKHLDAVAQRLDLEVRPGSRRTAGGEVVRWRAAGIAQAAADSSHPFFIEWALEAQFPGLAEAHHPAAPTGISKLVVNGDAGRLSTWLGRSRASDHRSFRQPRRRERRGLNRRGRDRRRDGIGHPQLTSTACSLSLFSSRRLLRVSSLVSNSPRHEIKQLDKPGDFRCLSTPSPCV